MAETTLKKSWEETQTDKLKLALKELGSGKNKICATLEAKKILGKFVNTQECPIARYIKQTFKNAESVSVEADTIEVDFPKGTIYAKPPKAVSDFIANFDEEKYYNHLDEDSGSE